MPVKYKAIYYSGRGRGEIVRQLLAYGGIDFEDVRYEHDEWLSKWKPLSPFGQCPWLEIDDGKEVIQLCQSRCIARYLARQFGIAGETLLDQCKVDMVADCISDYIVWPCTLIRREKDPEEHAKKVKLFEEESLPFQLKAIEKQMMLSNGGESGYIIGQSMTWVDMAFAHWMTWIPNGVKVTPPLDKFPKLKKVCENVEANPKVAAWLKKRPVTEL